MSTFTEFTAFERVPDTRKLYRTTAPLKYEIGQKNSGWWLEVEAGETFDISVPWYLEWVQNPHDPLVLLAALIHDRLLKRGFDVAFASSEFRRACIALGKNKLWSWILFTVTLIWTGVRRWVQSPQLSHRP